MKRIVSFLILLAMFIVILTLPASETPTVQHDPIPVWSILLYMGAVLIAGAISVVVRKTETIAV